MQPPLKRGKQRPAHDNRVQGSRAAIGETAGVAKRQTCRTRPATGAEIRADTHAVVKALGRASVLPAVLENGSYRFEFTGLFPHHVTTSMPNAPTSSGIRDNHN